MVCTLHSLLFGNSWGCTFYHSSAKIPVQLHGHCLTQNNMLGTCCCLTVRIMDCDIIILWTCGQTSISTFPHFLRLGSSMTTVAGRTSSSLSYLNINTNGALSIFHAHSSSKTPTNSRISSCLLFLSFWFSLWMKIKHFLWGAALTGSILYPWQPLFFWLYHYCDC